MRFLVLGNPENRRVQMFVDAARRLGCTPPQVRSWASVIRAPESLLALDGPFTVRLDSVGEDAEVAQLLRDRGRSAARDFGCEVVEAGVRADFGQVLAPRQTHLGFLSVLDALDLVWAQRPSWTVAQPPDTVRLCFDKNATAERLSSVGIPVPEAIPCADTDALFEALARTGGPLWIKLSCGSSASCLGILRNPKNPHLMTTLRVTDSQRFNSLKVCRVSGSRLRPVCDWLLGEGVRVEHGLPKARLDGANFDLRVLVIRGEPRFCIVRQARHPITNLHLGGWRGDVASMWETLGDAGLELEALCRAVGSAIPHWHLGVDVLVYPGFKRFAVLEVNAFGDLLPRLENGGLDTYGAEIAALLPGANGRMLGLGEWLSPGSDSES